MFEIILLVVMVATVVRVADKDDQSPVLWGAVALGLGLGCMWLVPLAYARVLLALVLTVAAMTAYKVIANK